MIGLENGITFPSLGISPAAQLLVREELTMQTLEVSKREEPGSRTRNETRNFKPLGELLSELLARLEPKNAAGAA
jgi:hypothetical protein